MNSTTETTKFRWTTFNDRTAAIFALSRTARLRALTARQVEIAWRVGDGYMDKQIAAELHITPETVGQYIKRIARRLGVDSAKHTRAQIVRVVVEAWAELESAA